MLDFEFFKCKYKSNVSCKHFSLKAWELTFGTVSRALLFPEMFWIIHGLRCNNELKYAKEFHG